jgi:hypothetical protein
LAVWKHGVEETWLLIGAICTTQTPVATFRGAVAPEKNPKGMKTLELGFYVAQKSQN